MWTCPNCGTYGIINEKFCPNCFQDRPEEEPVSEVGEMAETAEDGPDETDAADDAADAPEALSDDASPADGPDAPGGGYSEAEPSAGGFLASDSGWGR